MVNVENLVKLRDWLLANRGLVESHLDMNTYFILPDGEEVHLPEETPCEMDCGSSCCLIGFSVFSDMFPLQPGETFLQYSKRVFTEDRELWNYLFGLENPNDFDYAIERIEKSILTCGNSGIGEDHPE